MSERRRKEERTWGAGRQRQLFPDGFEVEAEALEAMGELDVARGLECARRAREIDPTLTNLDGIETALEWLEETLEGEHGIESATRAFLARPDADLSPGAAIFADQALARFCVHTSPDAFLDERRAVPRGALLLVLDRRLEAWGELRALAAECPDRGDVLGYAADAAWLLDQKERADELLVRALVADSDRVDLHRARRPELASLWRELRREEAEPSARARIFPEAWIRGMLEVPPENGWLDDQIARLTALAPPGTRHPSTRLRRFALLLYLDRSRPAGVVDLTSREELAELDPDLFRRVMSCLRELEGRAGR